MSHDPNRIKQPPNNSAEITFLTAENARIKEQQEIDALRGSAQIKELVAERAQLREALKTLYYAAGKVEGYDFTAAMRDTRQLLDKEPA